MITGLIDNLDNLIGSGASAAKLRAHLATLREQAEAMEARLLERDTQIDDLKAQAQNPALEAQCEQLQSDLYECRQTNERLAAEISQWQQADKDGSQYPPGANPGI